MFPSTELTSAGGYIPCFKTSFFDDVSEFTAFNEEGGQQAALQPGNVRGPELECTGHETGVTRMWTTPSLSSRLRRVASGGPLLAVLVCLAAAAHAQPPVPTRPDRYATDGAGVVDAGRLCALNERLAQLERETSSQVLVYLDRRILPCTSAALRSCSCCSAPRIWVSRS
jgi:hypothetical protein